MAVDARKMEHQCPTLPKNQRYHFGGPHNKDNNILGSILGSPISGNYHN